MADSEIDVAPYKKEEKSPEEAVVAERSLEEDNVKGASSVVAFKETEETDADIDGTPQKKDGPVEEVASPSSSNEDEDATAAGVSVAFEEPPPSNAAPWTGSLSVGRNIKNRSQEPEVAGFHDHFTLLVPSSTIRYRDSHSAARVLEGSDAQVVLEETFDTANDERHVSIRSIHDTSEGVRVLRLSYVLVTAFWTGFLFVFFLQILLFLFLDLAVQSGATSKGDVQWGKLLGAILAFPGFVHGLSCALVIAGAYIQDTWRGHYLIRSFSFRNISKSTVEWIFFVNFLGLPLLVLCFSLLARVDNWWEITTLVWFSCVAAFYVMFTVNVIFYEMQACWEVTRNRNKEKPHSRGISSWLDLFCRSIMARQKHRYSGRKYRSYLAVGTITDSEYTDSVSTRNNIASTFEEHINIMGKATQWKKFEEWGCYKNVEADNERIYSIDDARDVRPYITSYTWNLEKIYCRRHNSRYIAIIRGPGALTETQLKASLVCSFVGNFLTFFLCFSALVYLQLGGIFTTFLVVVIILIFYPSARSLYGLYKTREDLMAGLAHDEGNDQADQHFRSTENDDADIESFDQRQSKEKSECVYFQQEVYRITRPTRKFCWLMFSLEIGFCFFYPLLSLFSSGNYPLALLFALAAGISALRYYVSAAVVLEETGRMDLVDGDNELEIWRNQSRLNDIVGNITVGRSLGAWRTVLGSLGFIFLALMLGALGTEQETIATSPLNVYLNDFEYIQKDSLRYPTCQLSNELGASPLNTMADYAFLAGLAYRSVENTQTELDSWFGGDAIDQVETVEEFRELEKTSSAVSFKLVTFPNMGNFAYLLIRGTTTNWDALTDAQLWGAAIWMQMHRELLPFGAMWTPIIDQLITAITTIESKGIEQVSFYQDTGSFVRFLRAQNNTYSGVSVTGHSLGGGLAIITGAQEGIPAVALSGPNAMLSRRSFDPPISAEDLDSKTFNIVPDRDLVPRFDDVAQNFQKIRCTAGFADVIGCHSAKRALCEIIFSCGSNGRPVYCACVTEFGYPEPTLKPGANSTQSFAELCGIEEA